MSSHQMPQSCSMRRTIPTRINLMDIDSIGLDSTLANRMNFDSWQRTPSIYNLETQDTPGMLSPYAISDTSWIGIKHHF